jgi:predicted amidohydrolase
MVNLTSSGSKKVRAGFIQFAPELGDLQKNISRISNLLYKNAHADILVLPELANSGYNFKSKDQAFALAEPLNGGSYIDFLSESARKLELFIVSGFLELDEDRLYNTAVLIGSEGVMGKYRKIHLFMNEFDYFEKGDLGLPVFDLGFCKIGLLICFDWIFPEVWRILALKGADIICHPSNLVLPYAQQAVPVHGMINRIFVITANRYGTERDVTFSGKSFISNPYGETISIAQPDGEAVSVAEMDINEARDKRITERNHAFHDRFPSEYLSIIE